MVISEENQFKLDKLVWIENDNIMYNLGKGSLTQPLLSVNNYVQFYFGHFRPTIMHFVLWF